MVPFVTQSWSLTTWARTGVAMSAASAGIASQVRMEMNRPDARAGSEKDSNILPPRWRRAPACVHEIVPDTFEGSRTRLAVARALPTWRPDPRRLLRARARATSSRLLSKVCGVLAAPSLARDRVGRTRHPGAHARRRTEGDLHHEVTRDVAHLDRGGGPSRPARGRLRRVHDRRAGDRRVRLAHRQRRHVRALHQ